MGIRMAQYVGLNERSKELIAGEYIPALKLTIMIVDGEIHSSNIEPDGVISNVKQTPIGTIPGMYNDTLANLYRYELPNDTVYEEFIQIEVWSSGPMIFIALKDELGNVIPEFLWTDDEIREEMV